MHPSRRALLGLFATMPAVALGACSPSPVVTGEPAEPWTAPPAEPQQSHAAERAAAWTVGIRSLAEQSEAGPWAADANDRASVHLDRLLALDPLVGGTERVFAVTEPSAAPLPDPAALAARVDEVAGEGVDLFAELVREAGTQPERLLYASLGASAASNRGSGVPVAGGGGEPIRFPETTVDASLEVALTHVWALLNGLEVALGRLPDGAAHARAGARMGPVRELRNDLREQLGGDVPAQEISYDLPTDMSTPEEINTGLALLEARVLDALARLVAAGADDAWYGPMVAQVAEVHAWGGSLPAWPGWSEL